MDAMEAIHDSRLNASLAPQTRNYSYEYNPGSVHEETLELQILYRAATMLYTVCAPAIVSLGTAGNVLTVLVMWSMSRGHAPSAMSVYFTSLAVSDLVILYAALFRGWVSRVFGFNILNFHAFFCKILTFLSYVCGMTSSWFLVLMTLQRVTSVMFPHRVGLLCTRKKTQVMAVMIVAFFVLLNTHILYGYTVTDFGYGGLCYYVNDKLLIYYDNTIFPWIDLAFSSLLPFAILIVGNSLLVWKVIQSLRVVRTMTSPAVTDQVGGREKKASSLTTTVVILCVTFFCLTSPICVFSILYPYLGVQDARYEAVLVVVWQVCTLLWNSNSAVNFYLYCLTGSRFRSQLKIMFCKLLRSLSSKAGAWRSDVTASTSATFSPSRVSQAKSSEEDDF